LDRRQKLPNRLGELKIGTVGPLLATTEVKLRRNGPRQLECRKHGGSTATRDETCIRVAAQTPQQLPEGP